MGLADELADLAARGAAKPPRLMDRILATFNDEDRAALQAALENPSMFSSHKLSAFLKGKDRPISESAIAQWRSEHGYR